MASGYVIQQAIETPQVNTQQVVDLLIADEADRMIQDSGQELVS